MVVALDLTKSVDVKGPDGKTEFQKNIDGVTRLLASTSLNSHMTIIGITDQSFSRSYIILSADIDSDPGYFGERGNSARQVLVKTWKIRSAKLEPSYLRTDVIGALQLVGQLF